MNISVTFINEVESTEINRSESSDLNLLKFRRLYLTFLGGPQFLNDRDKQRISFEEWMTTLSLRLVTLTLLIILLVIHLKSMRVFRWEQSVTGGVVITYFIGILGLVISTHSERCSSKVLHTYITSSGAALMNANAAGLWWRWRRANPLTRAMAELLSALGVPLGRHIFLKVCLSIFIAICLLIDLALLPIFAVLIDTPSNDD